MHSSTVKRPSYWIRDLSLLAVLIGLLYGTMLGNFPLSIPDSARYAEIPREMVADGDYLTPHINGVKYFEKPPLFYWLQAGAIKIFGLGEWSIHLANAVMAVLTCLFVYVAGRKLYGRTAGILASMILATSGLFFAMGRIITLDITLTAFLSGSLFCFILGARKEAGRERDLYIFGMYLFAALATMSKGLVGILFPGMIILIWVAFFNRWRDLKNYHLVTGIIIFLLITAPWHILVQLKNPEFLRFYFYEQHFLRYFTPYAGREQPVWFFPAVFAFGFFPWVFFLPQAIVGHLAKRRADKRTKEKRATDIFLLLWPAIIFVFYLFSDSKLIPYILPVFPPLAVLLGNYLDNFHKRKNVEGIFCGLNIFCIAAVILGLGLAVFAFFFSNSRLSDESHAFYVTAGLLSAAAAATYLSVKFKPKYSLAVLITAVIFFLLSLPPIIGVSNHKTVKPLVSILQDRLAKGDEVASYRNYYQDLPYYLQRKITVVDFLGELEFGIKHTDANAWMLNEEQFWQRWNSKKRIFLLTDKEAYDTIKRHTNSGKLNLLGSYFNTILLSNKL